MSSRKRKEKKSFHGPGLGSHPLLPRFKSAFLMVLRVVVTSQSALFLFWGQGMCLFSNIYTSFSGHENTTMVARFWVHVQRRTDVSWVILHIFNQRGKSLCCCIHIVGFPCACVGNSLLLGLLQTLTWNPIQNSNPTIIAKVQLSLRLAQTHVCIGGRNFFLEEIGEVRGVLCMEKWRLLVSSLLQRFDPQMFHSFHSGEEKQESKTVGQRIDSKKSSMKLLGTTWFARKGLTNLTPWTKCIKTSNTYSALSDSVMITDALFALPGSQPTLPPAKFGQRHSHPEANSLFGRKKSTGFWKAAE